MPKQSEIQLTLFETKETNKTQLSKSFETFEKLITKIKVQSINPLKIKNRMKTKLVLLFVIGFLFAAINTKAQEFSGDSKAVSLTIIGSNVSDVELPLNIYVRKYVEQEIEEWQKKGEFEKSSDYPTRVNEQTRSAKVQLLTDEAVAKYKKLYEKSINWNLCELGTYDADNETFMINSTELGNFAIPVAIAEVPSFKQNWKSLKKQDIDFYVSSNKLVLAKVTFKNASTGKTFTYDSKQPTTYAANNITYNFEPIEVEVNQDVVVKNTNITTKETTVGTADVDIDIPKTTKTNEKTFAVIIANQNYTREVEVKYAANDGKIFKEYCEKTLGIPAKNIHYSEDATFGTMRSEIKWIGDVMSAYSGQAKVIFYYAGHGMPNEADKTAYLLPVDGFSSDFETAISLEDLYTKLTATESKNVTVFLDACFSGAIRDGGMLASARGLKIKPKTQALGGNLVVFSATSGDETAYPYNEKQHGLFTYFLLKKLQDTEGNVNYEDLADYIIENVTQQSIVVNQKAQTPQVSTSPNLQESWKILQMK